VEAALKYVPAKQLSRANLRHNEKNRTGFSMEKPVLFFGIERGYKPGYVMIVDHGRSFICAVYPPAMDEQSLNAGILDLATHQACGIPHRYGTR